MTSINTSPLISIVVAVYNCKTTLQQCLDSVRAQTYPSIELIVIDGGSTDGTIDIIQKNVQSIAYWVSEPDRGIYNAWNKALARATGDWICFLGADDYLWEAQVVARMAETLALIPVNIRVAYGQIMLLDQNGVPLHKVGQPWSGVKTRFMQAMSIPHQGVMHRRSLFELQGYFDEKFKICGDYELLLRELLLSDAVFLEDIVVSGMRVGGLSSSPKSSLALLYEARSAQVKNGLQWPGRIWLLAVVRVYIRLVLWHLLGEKKTRKLLDMGRYLMGQPAYWTRT
ncbi:glycosyltransferase family 2 protein [Rhodoferax sp.]|uniref:glycosyltransferase family 2 protein n=1 Tax=Rhodoferax sp. TaxID=50421 RepID=UPI0028510A09|nr:glycosyltransferase family 2 protein [Rhodoferax sp.]MDR3371566.1 glycosyltransferase family 2 protein [Rhodoferax sp.]